MKSNLPTEQEIIKTWKSNKPIVSIVCNTYNHEAYIEDALEGFLIQKTDFPFEILIHDDASKDNTPKIIKEYEKAYSNIIKPIYQTKNQFSQGISIIAKFQYSRANGNYIAFCEGDDYWTDKLKLQKCKDFLENNYDYMACSHSVKIINSKNEIETETPYGKYQDDLASIDDQIMYNNIPTLSLFHRNPICQEQIDLLEKMAVNCKYIGDIQIKCLILKFGKIKYFKTPMGVYRWNREQGESFSSQNVLLRTKDMFFAYLNVHQYLQYNSRLIKYAIIRYLFKVIWFTPYRIKNILNSIDLINTYLVKRNLTLHSVMFIYTMIITKLIRQYRNFTFMILK